MSGTKLIVIGVAPHAAEVAAIARETTPERVIELVDLIETAPFEFDLTCLDALDPASCEVFLALDARAVNFSRTYLLSEIKGRGLKMARLVSSRASVPQDLKLGENSVIYPGVVVMTDVTIGYNAVVRTGCLLEIGCKIGNSAYLESGAVIGPYTVIGDNTTVGNRVAVGANIKVGKQCELLTAMTYVNNIPDKTFYVDGYDGPTRIVRF
ncbi:MAG: hypothetical protein JO126_09130 [Alphaproteobacteria bacterium]|nr:hypothetical protein [Alphaproteobacteria bacterium]MBV8549604.1 hypothetical protein [Alphaproteobacteria bacterium]